MQICVATIVSIVILLGNSAKVRATTTEPVPTDEDDPAAPVCPMCCQGPDAVPGIPGVPGHPGQVGPYGPVGPKGDRGEPGQKGDMGRNGAVGETGAHGYPGPQGDDGIGLPGSIGPRGPPGLVGPTGEAGVKGQKGEPGETPDDSDHRLAFTVTRRTATDPSSDHSTRLSFEETVTLLPGTSFDLVTGTFTCIIPGTYVFMFSANKLSSNALNMHLMQNNNLVISAYSSAEGEYEQVSSGAVLVLQRGDAVYLTMWGTAHDLNSRHFTSFSGFLLYTE